MKLGIVISVADAETVWNALRLATFAAQRKDEVAVFLLGKGVECEGLNTAQFNVTGQMLGLIDAGGSILACGTCLKLRQQEGSELCPLSTMNDLYDLVCDSDRVLTF